MIIHTFSIVTKTTTTTTTTTAGWFDVPVGLSSQSVPYSLVEELAGEAWRQPGGLQGQRDESNDG